VRGAQSAQAIDITTPFGGFPHPLNPPLPISGEGDFNRKPPADNGPYVPVAVMSSSASNPASSFSGEGGQPGMVRSTGITA